MLARVARERAQAIRGQIIHDPPPAPPSPLCTPRVFLPKHEQAKLQQIMPLDDPSPASLPPPLRQPATKKYHLTPEDVSEIKRLRQEDPETWSRKALAEKFRCSPFFIGMVAEADSVQKEEQMEKREAVRKTWSRGKQEIRRQRGVRRDSWYVFDQT